MEWNAERKFKFYPALIAVILFLAFIGCAIFLDINDKVAGTVALIIGTLALCLMLILSIVIKFYKEKREHKKYGFDGILLGSQLVFEGFMLMFLVDLILYFQGFNNSQGLINAYRYAGIGIGIMMMLLSIGGMFV